MPGAAVGPLLLRLRQFSMPTAVKKKSQDDAQAGSGETPQAHKKMPTGTSPGHYCLVEAFC